ncbi:MAG: MafI family immunity protein [Candidatus Promineifilaceae bacterium]|nr:MafI family immunity protein [Anaerolineaceae bacterium]
MNRFKKATRMILDLAKDFEGRLADHIIFDVRDYVDHNEPGIAFRILYAQLYEFYIPISENEWSRIDKVGQLLRYDEQGYDWSSLKELIE